jgi:multiple sugar transport system substrate-binding protein
MHRKPAAAVSCLLLLLAGCPSGESPEGDGSASPPAGTSLSVVVIGDPELAATIEQFEAEWNEQTGVAYQVDQIAEADQASAGEPTAGVIVCPSHLLGRLAEDKTVAPIPRTLIEADAGRRSEVFSLLRAHESAWGGQALAIPFGSPVLTCYYRADLLEKLQRDPPSTWEQYTELAGLLSDRQALGDLAPPDDMPWHGSIEPLGPGWAGVALLARAAPYATHREIYSTLFDLDSMEPLIAGPPFVRALEQTVAAAAFGPAEQSEYDPAAVRRAFWEGRAALALTWPSAAAEVSEPAENIRVGFAELPGSTEVYNFLDAQWESRLATEDPRVPLLAASGRLGVVTARCQWPEAGFQLLLWLSGPDLSRQISTRSLGTTLFRASHLKAPGEWVEKPIAAAQAAEYAAITEQTLGRQQRLFALRIPGRPQYLAALDAAVHSVLQGDLSPQEALTRAAGTWQEVTDRLDRDRQRAAYLHSLGQQ